MNSLSYIKRAFSLIEILVVVAMLAVLAMLLWPVLGGYIEKSKAVGCADRLRDIGSLLWVYAGENDGKLRFFRDGSPTKRMWYTELRDHAGYSAEQARERFGCPSMDSRNVSGWYCYGFRLHGAPGKRVVVQDENTPPMYELTLSSVEQPSTFLIMADTVTASGEKQTFRIVPPRLYSGSGVHVRHQDRANVLFLDGHLKSLDALGLYHTGLTQVLDSAGRVITLE